MACAAKRPRYASANGDRCHWGKNCAAGSPIGCGKVRVHPVGPPEKVELAGEGYVPEKGTPSVQSAYGELHMPLGGLVDTAAEKSRLEKELQKAEAEIVKVREKLNNPNFTQKVPPQVLEEHKKRLVEWEAKRDQVQKSIDLLGS